MEKFISWRKDHGNKSRSTLESQQAVTAHFVNVECGKLVGDYIEPNGSCSHEALNLAINRCLELDATLIASHTSNFNSEAEALDVYYKLNHKLFLCDLPTTSPMYIAIYFELTKRDSQINGIITQSALAAKRKRGEALGGDAECWAKKAERCKNMSDDERKEYRTEICRAAGVANGERKSESARANVHNVAFLHFCQDWAQIHGEIRGRGTDWAKMSEVLNERGLKTAKGLDFNPQRAAAMFKKINETTFNNN